MARPVWRNEYQSRTASGIDIMIAFDVSLSMDIDDFIDQGDRVKRIDVAKMVVDDFIRRRPDDRMGLVAFAGRPRAASPITLDHKWLRNALGELRLNDQFDRGTIKEQGTAIGSALVRRRLPPRRPRRQKQDHRAHHRRCQQLRQNLPARGRRTRQDPRHQDLHHRHRHQGRPGGSQHHALSLSGIRPPDAAENRPLTGAEHYWAQDLESLRKTFTTIDQLEKTDAKSFTVIDDTELFPWFLGFTLLAALAAATVLALNPPPIALIR